MKDLIELFKECNKQEGYITVKVGEKRFQKYEVDYKFIEENDVLYIFFEPSDGRTDWVVNFSYWRKPYDDMEIGYRVHGGFLASWELIKDAIRAKVKERSADGRYKHKKVVIAGYSHGGALAALCHECVWFEREDLREGDGIVGISFDGPRMYGGLWVKKELRERWRNFYVFRNHSDIVTHLPPVAFFFRHVGTKVMIGAEKNPGLIKAHYPNEILKSLNDFVVNGAMPLKEKIISILQGALDVAEKARDTDMSDVREKFEEIVEKMSEE